MQQQYKVFSLAIGAVLLLFAAISAILAMMNGMVPVLTFIFLVAGAAFLLFAQYAP